MMDLYYWATPNGHKITIFLEEAGLPYNLHAVNIARGEQFKPDFLSIAPNNRIPALVDNQPKDGGAPISIFESGAILWYLAGGSDLAPDNRLDRAETLQWMFFEQHSLEPYLGAAHFWLGLVKGGREVKMHAVEEWMEHGYRAFGVMEKHLAMHDFFAADRYTIADIALYGYTHIANECDFDLTGFPAIRAWLKRIAGQAAHVRMDWHPTALAIAE